MFNNKMFNSLIIQAMHEQMTRLYQAAKELRQTEGQTGVAKLLNESPQTLNNWEARGISKSGMLKSQQIIGCDAIWLRDGVGEMVKNRGETSHNQNRRATDIVGGSPVRAVDENDENAHLTKIRKVKLRLSAGIVGFAVDPEEENGNPIYFRNDWLSARGYKPENLIAIRVKGESMEPNLHQGDTVVINTADTTPKDGEVYAVNYEGEDVIKRLVRDAGTWWLSSDNTDQRRFQRKECAGDMCIIIGKIIHKQSERI